MFLRGVYRATLPSTGPVVRVTGLRKPCGQIEEWRRGLLKRCYAWEGGRTAGGRLGGLVGRLVGRKVEGGKGARKMERAGIMGVVERGGTVEPGMRIIVQRTLGEGWWEMRTV